MSRYIDIEPIEKEIERELTIGEIKILSEHQKGVLDVYDAIKKTPTADVEEVRHGKPIVYEVHRRYVTGAAVDETGTPFLMRKEYVEKRERCPFCNATLFGKWGYYCDKCGAKMDKEKEE